MSDTDIHEPLTTVTVMHKGTKGGGAREFRVPAEPTSNPNLVITPVLTNLGGFTGRCSLTHIPTGRAVCSDEPRRLRLLVEKISGLDWSFTDIAVFRCSPTFAKVLDAIRDLRLTEPDGMTLPAHDAFGPDGKGKGLHRTALSMIADFLAEYQHADDRIASEDGPPSRVPGDGADGMRLNPEWFHLIMQQVHTYGLAYLLAALHRVDPAVADSAAAGLADAWETGDSLGEWVDEWRKQMDEGKPLNLPGIPGPLGDLFTPEAAR